MKEVFQTSLAKLKKVIDNPFIVVGGITLFGALLRLYHLGYKPLWLDEAVLYWIANNVSLEHVIAQNALHNSAPPLFALLLKFTLKIGDSESALRLLPWFWGVAAIPAMYYLAAQFLERLPAYLVSFMVSIAVTQVQYSQQLREYSFTFFVAIIILILFFKTLTYPSRRNWILMMSAMATGVFLQYGLFLLIMSLNFVYIIELLFINYRRKLIVRWVVSQTTLICAVVVVYFLSLRQQMVFGFGATSTTGYLSSGYSNGSIKSILALAIFNTRDIFEFTFPGFIFSFILIAGFIAAIWNKSNRMVLMMFASPIILTFITALARLYPYLGGRQVIFLTPMIYVLFGLGIEHLLKIPFRGWVVAFLFMLIVVTGLKSSINYLNNPGSENLKPISATLSKLFKKGDIIYIYYAAKPAFTYYYRDNIESQIYGVYSRGNPARYFRDLDKLLLSNKRVWTVYSHCYADECEIIQKYISGKRETEPIVIGTDVWLYLSY